MATQSQNGYRRMFAGMAVNPTDIRWNSVQIGSRAPGNLAAAQNWGDNMTSPSHPALPALWWLAFVIILVIVRFIWERMD